MVKWVITWIDEKEGSGGTRAIEDKRAAMDYIAEIVESGKVITCVILG